MKIKHIFSWLLLLGSCFCFSQNDSIPNVAPESVLKDGIYLSFDDLKTNNPLPKENVINNDDKTQSDFISKTLSSNKEIMFTYKGSQYRAEVSKIWGYCQNGNVYVHYADKFARITVFGNISHFLATVMVTRYVSNGGYGGYGMGMGYGGGYSVPVKQAEVHEFLMDYNSGDIIECTPTNLETFLSKDMRLYNQYLQIKKRKRKDFMILYIRKYNAEHPITIPVSVTGK